MELSGIKSSKLGAFGIGAALLLGAAGCSSNPGKQLAGADTNNDGVLSRQEAATYIINRFDQGKTRCAVTSHRRHGLSLNEIEAARIFGEQARESSPEHARVFLDVLSILERTYRDPLENPEILNPP